MSPFENKYVIGLTGNIAVGKSVVRQMLQHLGAYTIDADGLTHQAMSPGAPAYQPVIDTFGKFILDPEGRINRARLGAIAFAIPEALTTLESLVHPLVGQAVVALGSRAKQRVIVIEAIKLLESDLSRMVDAVWVVDATVETQVKRLLDKRKMSLDEARRRIGAQPPQVDKITRANVIIKNDGSVEDTWKQVQSAWNSTVLTVVGSGAVQQTLQAMPSTGTLQPANTPSANPAPTAPRPAAPPTARPNVPQQQPPAPQTPARPAAHPSASGTGSLPNNAAALPARPVAATPRPATGSLLSPKTEVVIRRGMPNNADLIAKFISRVTNKPIDRMEIMLAFGQKSYLLALGDNGAVISVIGWQVENLITRVDEFYLDPSVPRDPVISALVIAIEEASRELQSEVSFIFLPKTVSPDAVQAFITNGYGPLNLAAIKFPAWREAAHEMVSPDMLTLIKQLRADRVMKPI